MADQEINDAESEFATLKQRELDAQTEAEVLEVEQEKLANELEAAQMPAKPDDVPIIEEEIFAAEMRTKELEEEHAYYREREKLYEGRVDMARNAWLGVEGEAASNFNRKPRGSVKLPQPKRTFDGDPDLLDYKDRIKHPKYETLARFDKLHTDERARLRRLRLFQSEMSEEEQRRIMKAAQPVEYTGSMNPHVQPPPVNFYYDENLRVKHASFERSTGIVSSSLDERTELSGCISGELQRLIAELSTRALEGILPYSTARIRFEEALLAEVRSPGGEATEASAAGEPERDSLVLSLEQHSTRHASCVGEAETAWSRTYLACKGRISEAQLAAKESDCAARGEAVTLAAQELYKAAATAVQECQEEEAFQEICRNYCRDIEKLANEGDPASKAASDVELWRQALRLTLDLEGELAIQDGLSALLREKDRSRKLLAAELGAPADARRALAAVRAAHYEGRPLQAPNSTRSGYPTSDQVSNTLVVSPRRAAGETQRSA
jgi:hypothetical protein